MASFGRLRVMDGAHEGTTFLLERDTHTIGRSSGNDFHLADPTVSRTQAEFRCGADGVVVAGLSEKNPVWINGEMVGNVRRIALGDKIQLGLVHLIYEAAPAPAQAATQGPLLSVTTGTMFQGEAIPSAHSARIGNPCPSCGTLETSGARFCGTCGGKLNVAGPAVSPPPPPATVRGAQGPAPTVVPGSGDEWPAPSPPPPMRTSVSPRAATELAPGTVLRDRFEIKKLIGRGRITEVYLAYDRLHRRDVVVKVLVPDLAAVPETRDQFFNAANAFIVTVHPSLLRILEVHEDGDFCFCVGEPAMGLTLQQQMRSRPATAGGLPVEDVIHIGRALCDALGKLHAVGPHGNVRPEKVWVTPMGTVKLMEPGLLAAQGKAVAWPPAWDLGSAVYTAPEAMKGITPDTRADVYSVGAILFHLLTGEPPAGRLPPVSQMRRDVPSALAKAVDRALATRPDDRLPTAEALAKLLAAAAPKAGWVPGQKRSLVLPIAAAAVLLLGGTASSLLWFPPAKKMLRKSSAKRSPAELEPARAKPFAGLKELQEDASLAPFLDPAAAKEVDLLVKEGDALRDDWWMEKAEEKYAAAVKRVDAARESASGRRVESERAAASLEALAAALRGEAGYGDALGKVAKEAGDAQARAEEAPPAPTVKERVEQTERRVALRAQADLLAKVLQAWKAGLADAGLAAVRAEQDKGKRLLEAGEFAGADAAARAALVSYHRALCDRMRAALDVAVAESGGAAIAGLDEARKIQQAAAAVERTDSGAAAREFARAREAYAGLLAAAGAACRESKEAEQRQKRCPSCKAEGRCVGCPETRGKVLSTCPPCAGKGLFHDPCPDCKGKTTLPCASCSGSATAVEACPPCKGSGKKSCGTCTSGTVKCDNKRCTAGTTPCLRCNGKGKSGAMGEGAVCVGCKGTGKTECPVCKGAGTKPCGSCGGKGLGACPDCKETGKRTIPCPPCAGKGTSVCPKCEGKGTVPRTCEPCTGSGKASVDCGPCKGTGDCPDCGGGGRRK